MSSPEDGIKDLLVANGGGSWTFGTNLFIGRMIDQPDNVTFVISRPGSPPNPRYLIDFPSIQVIVRGNEDSYVAARTLAVKAKDILLGLPSQDLNGDRWVAINMIGDMAYVGADPKQRHMFSINFALIIEPAASGDTNREPL